MFPTQREKQVFLVEFYLGPCPSDLLKMKGVPWVGGPSEGL